MTRVFTIRDFAELVGTSEGDIPEDCRLLFERFNFAYRELSPDEARDVMRKLDGEIDAGKFSVAGKAKKPKWETGWQENLDEFVKSGYRTEALVPKYAHPVEVLRLNRGFVAPEDPAFEEHMRAVFKRWLFGKYLKDANPIYEFGCGPAVNLVPLAERFPEKTFYGFDWVEAPKKILELLKEKYGWDMNGRVFDMFAPDRTLRLERSGGVLLFSALEQLGSDFGAFLKYLIENKPAVVVHVDTLQELYDVSDPFDALAFKFAKARNYLTGYVPELKRLEREGKLEIVKLQRVRLGYMHYFDACSYDVWRPL